MTSSVKFLIKTSAWPQPVAVFLKGLRIDPKLSSLSFFPHPVELPRSDPVSLSSLDSTLDAARRRRRLNRALIVLTCGRNWRERGEREGERGEREGEREIELPSNKSFAPLQGTERGGRPGYTQLAQG